MTTNDKPERVSPEDQPTDEQRARAWWNAQDYHDKPERTVANLAALLGDVRAHERSLIAEARGEAPRVPPRPGDPPFDGSAPCPMCPMAIRNLMAVAHNTVTAWDGRPHKMPERMRELRSAVELAQPYADAHFADSMHSHGQHALTWREATMSADNEKRLCPADAPAIASEDPNCPECEGTRTVDGFGAGGAYAEVKCAACEPPSEDVMRMVHAFDDEDRKQAVRDLAARVRATESELRERRRSASASPDPEGHRATLERIAGMVDRASPVWGVCADALCWAREHRPMPPLPPRDAQPDEMAQLVGHLSACSEALGVEQWAEMPAAIRRLRSSAASPLVFDEVSENGRRTIIDASPTVVSEEASEADALRADVVRAREVLCASDYQTLYDAACQAMHEKQMAEEQLRNATGDLYRVRLLLVEAASLPPGPDAIVEGVRALAAAGPNKGPAPDVATVLAALKAEQPPIRYASECHGRENCDRAEAALIAQRDELREAKTRMQSHAQSALASTRHSERARYLRLILADGCPAEGAPCASPDGPRVCQRCGDDVDPEMYPPGKAIVFCSDDCEAAFTRDRRPLDAQQTSGPSRPVQCSTPPGSGKEAAMRATGEKPDPVEVRVREPEKGRAGERSDDHDIPHVHLEPDAQAPAPREVARPGGADAGLDPGAGCDSPARKAGEADCDRSDREVAIGLLKRWRERGFPMGGADLWDATCAFLDALPKEEMPFTRPAEGGK